MPRPITRRYVVVGVFAIGSDGHAVEPAYRLRTINIHSPVNKDWLAKTLTWAAYNNHEVRIRPVDSAN